MPLLTKIDVANLANRIMHIPVQRQAEVKDLQLAADALMSLSELVAVAWPIAIGE